MSDSTSWPNEDMMTTVSQNLMCNGTNENRTCIVELPYKPYNERIETYVVPFIFACILIVGVLGNGVLMITICRHSNMRNVPNTYVLSLAIGDLLVSIVIISIFNFSILSY